MSRFIDSFNKNKVGILFIIFSSLCTTWGQFFWKISSGTDLYFLGIGFTLYGIGAVLMMIAFKFGGFSVLHPMLTLGYIFALIIGYFLLEETIGTNKIIGIVLILLGVVILGVGDE
ncbi:hypothetical protein ASG89_10100 [Paenibacillus sp. Soil766]|uniref:EamA family transporter n=1 Tax=Paenibacillus sp. Soil766 TaxID=1736404 RepID=UPI00070DFE79|nr:EamA family transporter [Paenibacillus sp. Soil766]KRE86360.1 hypothetical protein ASG89_10100 [Paenibacillus sp. Soil766]